ncbi:MAG: type II toxin-antitoxin system RelB/DinJ family antitoxin [Candidatus Acididesulfobacter diazotrophicus]|uniref:Type II toxin-antitoxin system RelB/DinJ family antitoxin n=1 Tax=Candidatus Acididesulfobacter diazotrophicus TaxID=2597226 RepID=A0A519BM39_9DELT|nr:MAG: type II toxin-antitoxin system RelB/DinJ family antitoxin [Candidatus Acididesulfobacter diazotrophicus]
MKSMTIKTDEKRISTSIKLNKRNRDFAKDFFKKYNLTLSDGINIFLAKVVMDKKLPFELEIPNKKTMEAIREAENGEVDYFNSVEDLMKDLENC